MFRGLLEKAFPPELQELFGYPEEIAPPAKPYIFLIPYGGSVFDYRYVKEVNIYYVGCDFTSSFFSARVKGNGNPGRMI